MLLPLSERAPAFDTRAEIHHPWMLADPTGQFARNLNLCHFVFSHGLKDHPLFELPNLVELAKRPSQYGAYWSNGTAKVTDGWHAKRPRLSLVDTIANIGENNSLVILKKVANDPVYGPLFQELVKRVIELSGEQMRQEVVVGDASIVISSPNRVTSYHMDADCNFLMQAVGSKTLWIYDHNDRVLVPHAAREDFYAGDLNSITYPEDRQDRGTAYELHAGKGVHIPVFAPHWARNHDNISLAVAIIFRLRSVINEAKVYRVNRVLRRAGLAPTPPGHSECRDRLKRAAADAYYSIPRHFRPRRA